jgi:putative membrane protein
MAKSKGRRKMMDFWGGGVVMWLLLVVVVAVLAYFLVKGTGGTGGFGPTPHETPLDILKKRYARGEITKEQFEEIKRDL